MSADDKIRVLRGGGWFVDDPARVSAARRFRYAVTNRFTPSSGFRGARGCGMGGVRAPWNPTTPSNAQRS